jgi:hypothetical protein
MKRLSGRTQDRLEQSHLVRDREFLVIGPRRALPVSVEIHREDPEPICEAVHQGPKLSRGARARMEANHGDPGTRFPKPGGMCLHEGNEMARAAAIVNRDAASPPNSFSPRRGG